MTPSIRSVARDKGISRHAAAKLLNTLPDGYKTWMLFFDLHGEHADPAMLNLFEDVQQDIQPDFTVAGGDWASCDWASSFGNDSEASAEEEAAMVSGWLDRFRVSHYLEGNHEARVTREGSKLPKALRSVLSIPKLCGLAEKGIEWYPYDSSEDAKLLHIGKLTAIHGFNYNQYCAKTSAEHYGCVMHGHSHRCQIISPKGCGSRVTGISVGCGCPTTMPFERGLPPRGHMQAFAIVWQHPDGHFDFHVVRVVGPEVVVNGKLYQVRS
jgi:predicted phosphodiesterase